MAVCASRSRFLAGGSRFCRTERRVPDGREAPEEYQRSIAELIRDLEIDMLLPMTDLSATLLLGLRTELPGLKIPFPDEGAYRAASDKRHLLEIAASLGIPIPRSVVVESLDDVRADRLEAFGDEVGYPLYLKPHRSVVMVGGCPRSFGVRAVKSSQELTEALGGWPEEAFPILVQERIEGPGLGAFLLFAEGRQIAAFAHRRIREKPPTGGVSVYRESVELRADVGTFSRALLEHFGWSGVAMVEFKEDAATGTPYLMEVNARFWGSLQLAVDAGVDFPTLLVRSARGEAVEPIRGYRLGVRSRWLWGDVDHLIWMLKAPRGYRRTHPALPSRAGAVARALVPWRRGDRLEVLRLDDPMPFVRESAHWLGTITKRLFRNKSNHRP